MNRDTETPTFRDAIPGILALLIIVSLITAPIFWLLHARVRAVQAERAAWEANCAAHGGEVMRVYKGGYWCVKVGTVIDLNN